jgi:hypothetical protein
MDQPSRDRQTADIGQLIRIIGLAPIGGSVAFCDGHETPNAWITGRAADLEHYSP